MRLVKFGGSKKKFILSRLALLGVLLILGIATGGSLVYAGSKVLAYLPRTQELDAHRVQYNNYIFQSEACALNELIAKIALAGECLEVKKNCSDCCLAPEPPPAVAEQCSVKAHSKYAEVNSLFGGDSVIPEGSGTTTIGACMEGSGKSFPEGGSLEEKQRWCRAERGFGGCEERGCPAVDENNHINTRPYYDERQGQHCVRGVSTNEWVCNVPGLSSLQYEGSPQLHGGVACSGISKYTVTELAACPSNLPVILTEDLMRRAGLDSGSIFSQLIRYRWAFSVDAGSVKLRDDFQAGFAREKEQWERVFGANSSKVLSVVRQAADICYKYQPTATFINCAEQCVRMARNYEQYIKNSNCCNYSENVCCAQYDSRGYCTKGMVGAEPGYLNNCSSIFCKRRIDWPQCQRDPNDELCCENITSATLAELNNELQSSLIDVQLKKAGECFKPLKGQDKTEDFAYTFVAHGNQKIVAMWQMHVDASYRYTGGGTEKSPEAVYFYSTLKVFDVTEGGKEVFPKGSSKGALAQRAFFGSFSVFAAMSFDGIFKFEQGHEYAIKIYYFLPKISDYEFYVKVHSAEISVIKIRE